MNAEGRPEAAHGQHESKDTRLRGRKAIIRLRARSRPFLAERYELRDGWLLAAGRWRWRQHVEVPGEDYTIPEWRYSSHRSYIWSPNEVLALEQLP